MKKQNPFYVLGWGRYSKEIAKAIGFSSKGHKKGSIVGVLLFRCSADDEDRVRKLIEYSGAVPEQAIEGVASYIISYKNIDFAKLATLFDEREVFRLRLLLNFGWEFIVCPTLCSIRDNKRFVTNRTNLYSMVA